MCAATGRRHRDSRSRFRPCAPTLSTHLTGTASAPRLAWNRAQPPTHLDPQVRRPANPSDDLRPTSPHFLRPPARPLTSSCRPTQSPHTEVSALRADTKGVVGGRGRIGTGARRPTPAPEGCPAGRPGPDTFTGRVLRDAPCIAARSCITRRAAVCPQRVRLTRCTPEGRPRTETYLRLTSSKDEVLA
jgi:hypothetical protein